MRKFLKFLTSRLGWTVLFFLIQFVLIYVSLQYFQSTLGLSLFNFFLGLIVTLYILARDSAEEYKLSWIIMILIVPIFGACMYLIFGNKKYNKQTMMKFAQYQKAVKGHSIDVYEKPSLVDELDSDDARLSKYVTGITESRVYGNNTVDYYNLGDDSVKPLLDELSSARKFIFMEYFIYEKGYFWDKILTVLKEKAAQGVDVYLMYDDMGSINTLPKNYCDTLGKIGIKAIKFNPVRLRLNHKLNYRDHRKIVVIDGNTAISGGVNIADEYINRKIRFGHWKDNSFTIKGDGVWNYTFMFLQLWNYVAPKNWVIDDFSLFAPTSVPSRQNEEQNLMQSFSDSPLDNVNVAENAYVQVLNIARDYVWISTPYLVLDATMINALILAAQSGVDVRIITPGIPDKKLVWACTRSNYRRLVENGVHIYEYTPGFIHAKMFLSDDKRAIVGTTNMDFRSFFLHFECGSIFYGGTCVQDVKKDFEHTFDLCHEMSMEDISRISRKQKLIAMFAKILAPLL